MAEIIHALRRGKRMRYRIWGTCTDTYLTEEMSAKDLRAYLIDRCFTPWDVRNGRAKSQIAERIARADANGTSAFDRSREDLDGPWEEERCRECGGFHHAFEASVAPLICAVCGNEPCDPAHGPRCAAKAGGWR